MTETYYITIDLSQHKSYSNGIKERWAHLPQDFWGHSDEGYTAYRLTNSASYEKWNITPDQDVVMNDILTGGGQIDRLFGGGGDDQLNGRNGDDYLIGGSGDDSIIGEDNSDKIFGDWADFPDPFGLQNYSVPSHADQGISGDDLLFGGDGGDTIIGGPGDDSIDGGSGGDIIDGGDGNDRINAGPRGDGNLDDVTGGAGADLFMLNYDEEGGDSAGSFWRAMTSSVPQEAGRELVRAAIVAGGTQLLKDEVTQVAPAYAGMLMGPIGGAAGVLAEVGIEALLKMGKSNAPKGEDLLVIRDFDPREDVIMLPVDIAKTFTSSVVLVNSSAVDGNSSPYIELDQTLAGYALSFRVSGVEYAQAFLSDDYIDALGIGGQPGLIEGALQAVLNTAMTITPNGLIDSSGTLTQEALENVAYAFSGIEAQSRPDWQTPTGTKTIVFGAFGPMVINGSANEDRDLMLAGSNFGDLITVNSEFLAPDEIHNNSAVTSNKSFVFGFDGDDVIYGGNGSDFFWGGAGDDVLYGFDVQHDDSSNFYNGLHGDDGDDILVAGAGTSAMDGGSGTDFVSYELSPNGVTVHLSDPPDLNVPSHSFASIDEDFPGVTFTGYATGFSEYDIFASIEGVIGSAFDDVVYGSGHHDNFRPGHGNDTFYGGSGADYLDYSDQAAGVIVDLSAGTTQKLDGNSQDTHTSVAGLTGTAFDDTLLGHGGSNWFLFSSADDKVDGRDGADTLDYGAAPGRVVVNIGAGQTAKFGYDDAGHEILIGIDHFNSIEAFKGSAFDDTIYGGSFVSSAASAMSMAPEGSFAALKALQFEFHGGKGDDTVVFDGSVGDARIARDLSKVVSGGIKAGLKKIEVWEFDDHTIKAHRFDVALTNLEGAPKVKGGDAHELIVGHTSGRDHLVASKGNDTVLGLGGDDLLHGRKGKDHLHGGDGDDRLVGGPGRDRLEGGAGMDTYVFHHALAGNGAAANGVSRTTLKKADIVIGFEQGETIIIDSAALASRVGGRGPLDADYFHVGRKAGDDDHHLVLDAKKGLLLVDLNGDAKGGITVLAKFKAGDLPEAGDIVIA